MNLSWWNPGRTDGRDENERPGQTKGGMRVGPESTTSTKRLPYRDLQLDLVPSDETTSVRKDVDNRDGISSFEQVGARELSKGVSTT